MAKRVNISTARKELPALFDRVTSRDGERVVICRRDGGSDALLVSRDYVEGLERTTRQLSSATDFRLMGSGELLDHDEDIIEAIRAQEAQEAEMRLDELAGRRRR